MSGIVLTNLSKNPSGQGNLDNTNPYTIMKKDVLVKIIMYKAIGAFLTVLLLSSCNRWDYALGELLAAPESIEIGGREFVMETYIVRDFEWLSPPDGMPMCAVIWVVSVDTLPFPSSINFDYLWVVNKDLDVWATEFDENQTVIQGNKLRKVAMDGPKWDVEPYPVLVDAVVEVTDGSGNEHLLQAADQIIHVID